MDWNQAARCIAALCVVALAACGSDNGDACDPNDPSSCDDGQVCEAVTGRDAPACFAPVYIVGRVFDGLDETGIAGARVVALDANGGARSEVAESGSDPEAGAYRLPIPAPRDEDGNPLMESVTLRVAAASYQPFAVAPRTALPIELSAALRTDAGWEIENAATDVALLPLPGDTAGLGRITGRVAADDPAGALVIAERDGVALATAVADTNGEFVLFNVAPGTAVVAGYRAGLRVEPATAEVPSAGAVDVTLNGSHEGVVAVTGSVNIVNAPGGSMTSVILVVASTFDEEFIRGDAPAGLRVGEITGGFTIPDVPPGTYKVLAAYENDRLVRDPDESIAGTDIVEITVDGTGDVTLEQSFKITEALPIDAPTGAALPIVTDADPTFVWGDDSSEDGYECRVFDAFGNLVLEDVDVPRVNGSPTVSYTWEGASLIDGMIYQVRTVSWREDDRIEGGRAYISASEDLTGVFQYAGGS